VGNFFDSSIVYLSTIQYSHNTPFLDVFNSTVQEFFFDKTNDGVQEALAASMPTLADINPTRAPQRSVTLDIGVVCDHIPPHNTLSAARHLLRLSYVVDNDATSLRFVTGSCNGLGMRQVEAPLLSALARQHHVRPFELGVHTGDVIYLSGK
jgi:hypothetical protein